MIRGATWKMATLEAFPAGFVTVSGPVTAPTGTTLRRDVGDSAVGGPAGTALKLTLLAAAN